jgi:hypothetical protein
MVDLQINNITAEDILFQLNPEDADKLRQNPKLYKFCMIMTFVVIAIVWPYIIFVYMRDDFK